MGSVGGVLRGVGANYIGRGGFTVGPGEHVREVGDWVSGEGPRRGVLELCEQGFDTA